MIRDAVCALLDSMPGITQVSSVANGPEALSSITSLRPDVVMLEFPQPPNSAVALIAGMKREWPETRIIVLTFHKEEHQIEAVMRAGADGYVLKRDTRVELSDALDSVFAGKVYLTPSISDRVMRGSTRGAVRGDQRRGAASDITQRERQVIRLIAAGHRTREIAQLLSVSHKTVEKHRSSIMRKLGLPNASAVAAFAIAHGLADG